MIDEGDIIRIARQEQDVLLYKDFEVLRPTNTIADFWKFRIKNVLIDNGYVCHERKHRDDWYNCGYYGVGTHFHKPQPD